MSNTSVKSVNAFSLINVSGNAFARPKPNITTSGASPDWKRGVNASSNSFS